MSVGIAVSSLSIIVSVENGSDWKRLVHFSLLIEDIIHGLSIRKVLIGDMSGRSKSWSGGGLSLLLVVSLVVTGFRILRELGDRARGFFATALLLSAARIILIRVSSRWLKSLLGESLRGAISLGVRGIALLVERWLGWLGWDGARRIIIRSGLGQWKSGGVEYWWLRGGCCSGCSLLLVMTARGELRALHRVTSRGVHHDWPSRAMGLSVVAGRVGLWWWKSNHLGLLVGGSRRSLSMIASRIVIVGSYGGWLMLSGGLARVTLVVVGTLIVLNRNRLCLLLRRRRVVSRRRIVILVTVVVAHWSSSTSDDSCLRGIRRGRVSLVWSSQWNGLRGRMVLMGR